MDTAFDLTRQARWEVEASRRAEARYKEAAEASDPSALPSGKRLLRAVVPPLTALIITAQAEAMDAIKSPSGRLSGWQWPIQLLSAPKLAYITVAVALRALADRGGGDPGLTWIAGNPSAAVRVELEYERWVGEQMAANNAAREAGATGHRNVLAAFRARYPKADRKTWARWRKKIGLVREAPWSEDQKIQFGAKLVELLAAAAPEHFSVEAKRLTGGRTQNYLVMSEDTQEMMDDVEQRAAVSRPMMMPMRIPPRPWRYE